MRLCTCRFHRCVRTSSPSSVALPASNRRYQRSAPPSQVQLAFADRSQARGRQWLLARIYVSSEHKPGGISVFLRSGLVLAGVDLNNIGLGDVNVSSNVASELASAASTLDSVVNGGDSVAASLNKYGIVGLDNARTKYQPESLKVCGMNVGSREQHAAALMFATAPVCRSRSRHTILQYLYNCSWLINVLAAVASQVQNTYLPVVLGVEYALLVVLAIVATVLLVLERPRTGGFFLLLFWICLIPVMFTGPGASADAKLC